MHVARMRSATIVDGGPPHPALGTRSRQNRLGRWHLALPTSSSALAQRHMGDRAASGPVLVAATARPRAWRERSAARDEVASGARAAGGGLSTCAPECGRVESWSADVA